MFGSPLTVPDEFLEGGEILPSRFLQKIEQAVCSRFKVPQPHHVSPAPHAPLLPALLAAKFVLVREDASVPPLAPLYCCPYLVLEQWTKFLGEYFGGSVAPCLVSGLLFFTTTTSCIKINM